MLDDYIAAKRLGLSAYRKAVLSGRYPYLPSLDEIIKDGMSRGEVIVGEMEINLADIAGTKTSGRQQAFASNFMPLLGSKSEFASKWMSLYDAALEEGIRDPILAYEYYCKFYVEEGNKRVSVMKFNKAVSIPAKVIRILPARTDTKEGRIYEEFLIFFKCTGLYGIYFSESGRYEKLGRLLGQSLDKAWPAELIMDLRAGFGRFSELFSDRGGGKLGVTPGDAFLVYMSAYGLDSLLHSGTDALRGNLDGVWNEYRKSSEEVQLVSAPEPRIAESAEKLASAPPAPKHEIEESLSKSDPLRAGALAGSSREAGLSKAGPVGTDSPKPGSAVKEKVGALAGMLFSVKKEPAKKEPVIAAFLYEKDPERSSWAYGHELGRNYLAERYGSAVRTLMYTDCDTEEKILAAVDDAREKGAVLAFTTAGVMADASLKAAVRHPDMHILNCSVYTPYNSIRTYYGRMYEAKFLMGALAASVTDGNDIGYVESLPLYGTVSSINAFAIGAQMVNPWTKIHLCWKEEKGRDWRKEFEEKQILTVSGPDMTSPSRYTREFGVYMMSGGDVVSNVAMPVFNWGMYYVYLIQAYMDGAFSEDKNMKNRDALNYWFGLGSGVIGVILSEDLHYASRRMVEFFRQEISSGRLSPFSGELHSQEGLVREAGGSPLLPKDIVSMRWLNDNVIGEIPSLSSFSEESQALIRMGGFLS